MGVLNTNSDSKQTKDTMARSWFCTFNNPEEFGFDGDPQEICNRIVATWVGDSPTRTCACSYCISAGGLKHCHMILEDNKNMRFSAVKKVFPKMNFDATKGNKQQAEDYIYKRGTYAEKGEIVLATAVHGEIKGRQGRRREIDTIGEMLEQGMTPSEIFASNFSYRKYEKYIRDAYFAKKKDETPVLRDVKVFWHVGESGSGKTFEYVKLCEQYGEDEVYLLTDYDKGGFDLYGAQKILCMDEFRGQMKFQLLLNYLDGYRVQIPCRYGNAFALWSEVHIFTVLPPDLVYKTMVTENRNIDSYSQLKRRIDTVVYHWKSINSDGTTSYLQFAIPMSEYKSYEDLKFRAETGISCPDGFSVISDDCDIPNEF